MNALEADFLRTRAEFAALQFVLALQSERKANFNPNQPRVPRGTSRGGEWLRVGDRVGNTRLRRPRQADFHPPDWSEIEVGFRGASREVQQFLARNRDPITRVLGALQAAGGVAEVFGGAAVVGGGAVTSEVGVGIAIAGAGGWMVANGYDNFLTGWRTLLTGYPHETNLNTALRNLGLSDDQARTTEILLAGGASVGAARLSREALEGAARVGLAQRAVRAFAQHPLVVRAGTRRIWDEPNIVVKGEAWEAFDAGRTGYQRTPGTFSVFDQFDESSRTAISNKVLDLTTPNYSRVDRSAVYNRLATFIDRVAAFRRDRVGEFQLSAVGIRERRLHVLFPAGESFAGAGTSNRRCRALRSFPRRSFANRVREIDGD